MPKIKFYTKIELLAEVNIVSADINSNVMEPDEYEKLKENILRTGFSDPIKVTKDGKAFLVIDGHHRLRALRELGVDKIPCIILDTNRAEKKISAINLNTIRGTQNPKELAKIIKQLLDEGHPLAELEKLLVYKEPEMLDRLSLLDLPDNVAELLRQQSEEEEKEAQIIWSFLTPKSYAPYIEKVMEMFGEQKGKAFGEMCKRLSENAEIGG